MSSNSSSWIFVWIPHGLTVTPTVAAWVQEKITGGANLFICIGYNLLIGPSDFNEHHAFSAHNYIIRKIDLQPGSGMLRIHTQRPVYGPVTPDPAMTIREVANAEHFTQIYICTAADDMPALVGRRLSAHEQIEIVGF